MNNDVYYMKEALNEARRAAILGEIPVGAVIVDEKGVVVGTAHNLRETTNDATAHAEIVAIREASKKLKSWRLDNCSIYVTLEPCPMCAGAILAARFKRLIYGAMDMKMGAVESIFALLSHEKLKSKIDVRAGVLEDECKNVLREFFRVRRS